MSSALAAASYWPSRRAPSATTRSARTTIDGSCDSVAIRSASSLAVLGTPPRSSRSARSRRWRMVNGGTGVPPAASTASRSAAPSAQPVVGASTISSR